MSKLSESGVVHLLVPLILLVGIIGGVFLVTQGDPFKLFSKAAPVLPSAPETSFTLELEQNPNPPYPDEATPDAIQPGNKFRVDIYARSDIDPANLFSAKLIFPKDLISVESIDQRNGQSLVKNWVETAYDNSNGVIDITGGIPSPGIKTDTTTNYLMASIIFTAKAEGDITINFNDSSAIFSNSSNINILTKKNPLSFKARKIKSIPTDSPVAPASSKPSPCGDLGDVNGDRAITKDDADLILKANVGSGTLTVEQQKRANVTGSQDPSDPANASAILQYLNGAIRTFPLCSQPADSNTLSCSAIKLSGGILGKNSSGEAVYTLDSGANTTLHAFYNPQTAAIAWSSSQGRFDDNTHNPVNWTAPSVTSIQSFTIGATVTNNGQSAECPVVKLTVYPPKPQPPSTVNTLDYFLSDHPDKGLTGTHPVSQEIDLNLQRMYLSKWADAGDPQGFSSRFEVFTWDENNIYLKEDHSSAPVPVYSFNPGTWMKRSAQTGDKVTTPTNSIQVYDANCKAVPRLAPLTTGTFPIELTLERREPNFNIYTYLGQAQPTISDYISSNQDVIVIKYDSSPGNTGGIYERYYLSKEWGMILWEEYNKSTNAVTNKSYFTKIQNNPLKSNKAAICVDVVKPSPVTLRRDGDVNSDGRWNLTDFSSLLTQYIPGKSGVVTEADLNVDRVVNSIDAIVERNILIDKGVIRGAVNPLPASQASCADKSVEQSYSTTSMVGCNGGAAFVEVNTLCGSGSHVCSVQEYVARGGGTTPATAIRWLSTTTSGIRPMCSSNLCGGVQCETIASGTYVGDVGGGLAAWSDRKMAYADGCSLIDSSNTGWFAGPDNVRNSRGAMCCSN